MATWRALMSSEKEVSMLDSNSKNLSFHRKTQSRKYVNRMSTLSTSQTMGRPTHRRDLSSSQEDLDQAFIKSSTLKEQKGKPNIENVLEYNNKMLKRLLQDMDRHDYHQRQIKSLCNQLDIQKQRTKLINKQLDICKDKLNDIQMVLTSRTRK